MIDYEKICRQTISVAVEAGQLLKKERKSFRPEMVETKGLHDFVSYVDKASERLIVDGLLKMLPDAGFITEEGTVKTEDRHYKWIIDPLDGTTNFIHGISPFAVSIALMEGNDVVIGVATPITTSLPSISAILTAKGLIPCIKLVVPSRGSMIHL